MKPSLAASGLLWTTSAVLGYLAVMQKHTTAPPATLGDHLHVASSLMHVTAMARTAGQPTMEFLNQLAAMDRRWTNASNRRGKPGRAPNESWGLRCGMHPVDALMIPKLLDAVGAGMKPAAFDRMLASHAIDRANGKLAGVRLDVRLKSLRDNPPAKIVKALYSRMAKIGNDPVACRLELKAIASRVWPGETNFAG